jgi:hypothetical protein
VRPDDQTTVERAFELARMGSFRAVEEIIRQLNKEGFADPAGQLSGKSVRKQLRGIMKAAQQLSEGAAE